MLLAALAACSTAPYRYDDRDESTVTARSITQEKGAFRVSAAVPTAQEAERLFGIPLEKRNIQPVWLEVHNASNARARFATYSIDRDYFPPHEVAYMYRKNFSKQGWLDMEQRFFDLTIPRHIEPGETESGWVFTNNTIGTKAFNVDIYYTGRGAVKNEHFTFFVTIPGIRPDHADVDFTNLYTGEEIHEVDVDGLRTLLADLPCCTTDREGEGQGQPVNIVIVANGKDLLQALLRAGWNESMYERNDKYLEATDYLFGRPPDAIFRMSRGGSVLAPNRNEMGVWAAPVRVDGVPVWMAQIKHAIGRRFEFGEMFLSVRIDPDVNDGRNYLLQNLWYAQSLQAGAWSHTGLEVSQDEPMLDFKNSPFFSDGYRFVMWVSGDPVALDSAKLLDWDDPKAELQ